MISVLGRCQFSAEKAYRVRYSTFNSPQPSTHSRTACAPASWPLMRGNPRDLAQRPLPSMMIAIWRGTVLVLADIGSPYHLEFVAERQVAWIANDEIRMTKLEGMMNDQMTNDPAYRLFVIRASGLIRHSTFVLCHLGGGKTGASGVTLQNDRFTACGADA